jgi:hypothetical protein
MSHQTAQPTISRFVVISGVPLLSNGKTLHRNRAGMDCEVIDLCKCLANISRQRGDQVGGGFRVWPVCNDAFLLGPSAKIHSQIGTGQSTSDIAVIGYAVSR